MAEDWVGLGGKVIVIPVDLEQANLITKRELAAARYSKKVGWNFYNLSLDQLREIHRQPEWPG